MFLSRMILRGKNSCTNWKTKGTSYHYDQFAYHAPRPSTFPRLLGPFLVLRMGGRPYMTDRSTIFTNYISDRLLITKSPSHLSLAHHDRTRKHIFPVLRDFKIQTRTIFGLVGTKRREYSERRILGYSMQEMFEVVSDVSKYQEFLPFCSRSEVLKRRGNRYLEAALEVGFPPFVERYTSTVEMTKPHSVIVTGTDGSMFNHLSCRWRFSPGLPSLPRTCTLDFAVSYEFKSLLLAATAEAAFDAVQRQQVEAFLKRAEKKFGGPSISNQKPRVVMRK